MFEPTKQKEHITREHLKHIKTKINNKEPDDILFWSIVLVAFYGLACFGELLPKSEQDASKVSTIQALKFEK